MEYDESDNQQPTKNGRIWAVMQEHISEMQRWKLPSLLQTQQEEHIKMTLEALG